MRYRCTIKMFPLLDFFSPYECCTWLPFGLNLPYFSPTLNIILHTQIWGYQWWLLLTMEVQEDKHSNSGANNGLMSQALQIRFVFVSCPLFWYSGYNYEAPLHHQNVSFTWLFLHLTNAAPDCPLVQIYLILFLHWILFYILSYEATCDDCYGSRW